MPIFGWFSATRAAQRPSLVKNYIQVSTRSLVQTTAVYTSQFARPRSPGDYVSLGEITMGSSSETIVITPPTVPTDITNKEYVDSVAAGLDPKESSRAASTANIDLATGGLLTVDTTALADGNRVLVKDQAIPAENGIYLARSGAWERAPDFNGVDNGVVSGGASSFVETGSQAGNGYVVVFDGIVDVGTDAITWVLHTGGGSSLHVGETITPDGIDFSVGGNPTAGAADSTTLVHYQSATVTLIENAGSDYPNRTAVITRIGNLVTARIQSASVTLNGSFGFMQWTGLPAWARPVSDVIEASPVIGRVAGTPEMISLRIAPDLIQVRRESGANWGNPVAIEIGDISTFSTHYIVTWSV